MAWYVVVQIQRLEEAAKSKEEELHRKAMAIHHAEQEVVRLQCLVESLTKIYPSAVAQVQRIQLDFNFKDRGLADLANFRSGRIR